MNYLTHDEIKVNSIIVIDFEDGTSTPYFVNQKSKGAVSGATMLLGHKLSDFITNPNLYPCSITGGTDCFYIANEKVQGCDRRVKGYRRLEKKEKDEWIDKIELVHHINPLLEVLSVC